MRVFADSTAVRAQSSRGRRFNMDFRATWILGQHSFLAKNQKWKIAIGKKSLNRALWKIKKTPKCVYIKESIGIPTIIKNSQEDGLFAQYCP